MIIVQIIERLNPEKQKTSLKKTIKVERKKSESSKQQNMRRRHDRYGAPAHAAFINAKFHASPRGPEKNDAEMASHGDFLGHRTGANWLKQ